MKSLMLLPLLALSTTALAGEVMVGVSGGTVIMDPLETLGTGWTVVPRVDYFFTDSIGLEVEAGFLGGRTQLGDYAYSGVTPRLNMVGRLWTEGIDGKDKPPFIRPLLVAGIGGFYKNVKDNNEFGEDFKRKDVDLLLNAGPGVLIPLGKKENVHLRSDLRWLINLGGESFRQRGDRFVDWEWTAGIGISFGGPKDTDGDGIVDDEDKCVDSAEDRDGFEDEDGCPEADNDGDGVLDADDQCPNPDSENAVEDMDGFEDGDGCADLDNDADGISDVHDQCPDVAGMKSAEGCPDEDEDGIVDEEDECVDEAGPAASFGCVDEDGDLVPDYRDHCPTEPAPKGADPLRSDGCPKKVFITKDAIKILDKVFFDVGKASIKSKSNSLLDDIASTLNSNLSIKKIKVEGHTDNTGDPTKNKTLSQARAEAVVAYLVSKEVDAARLEAVGFGQEKPLTEGEESDTKEGRAKNRRVEFNITEQEKVEVVFIRERLTVEDHDVGELKKLKVIKAVLPAAKSVIAETTCEAIVTISAEGDVTDALVRKCVALPRSVTRRTLKKWTFEPVVHAEGGEPVAVTVDIEIKYSGGRAFVDIDEDSVKPVE